MNRIYDNQRVVAYILGYVYCRIWVFSSRSNDWQFKAVNSFDTYLQESLARPDVNDAPAPVRMIGVKSYVGVVALTRLPDAGEEASAQVGFWQSLLPSHDPSLLQQGQDKPPSSTSPSDESFPTSFAFAIPSITLSYDAGEAMVMVGVVV